MSSQNPQITTRAQRERNHQLLLSCLNTLDEGGTLWAHPTVTMAQRIEVLLQDDRINGAIYPEVMRQLLWLQDQNRIGYNGIPYNISPGAWADMLTRTHPDAPVIYPVRDTNEPMVWRDVPGGDGGGSSL